MGGSFSDKKVLPEKGISRIFIKVVQSNTEHEY